MNLAILPNPKPGFKSADTQFSGLCFSAAFCEFQQQIVQWFNAFSPVIVHFTNCPAVFYCCLTPKSQTSVTRPKWTLKAK